MGRRARAGGAAVLGALWLGVAPAAAVPVIARIGPAPVAPGDLLTVLGSGFGPAPGVLTIGGVPAPLLTWGDRAVRAWVPELTPGPTALAVQAPDGVTAPLPIDIAPPPRLAPVAIPLLAGAGGAVVQMDARLSLDPDDRAARLGTGLYALWSFGDGEEAAGAVVRHAYRRAGRYTVRLHVWDASGLEGTGVARLLVAPAGAVRVASGPGRRRRPRRRRDGPPCGSRCPRTSSSAPASRRRACARRASSGASRGSRTSSPSRWRRTRRGRRTPWPP